MTTLSTDHGLTRVGPPLTDNSAPFQSARRIYAHKWTNDYKFAPGLIPIIFRRVSDYDVVHIHALFTFTTTVAAWAARARGVPYIVRPLGTLSCYGMHARRRLLKRLSVALIEKAILRNAAVVHFTSDVERREAEELGLTFRGVVVPLGVEAPAVVLQHPTHLQRSNRRLILFLSRLDPKKNIEALIDAFAFSPMLRAGSALLIAGSGSSTYVDELKARCKDRGIADLVVWLGHVEGDAKAAALHAADVFVLPSFSENFGIAAVEALFAGLPCVLAEGVAIAEDVARAGAGIVVPPKAAEVARALESLLDDEAERRSMANRARIFAEDTFSSRVMGQRLIEIYQNVRAPRRTNAD
ncbi:Alpha-monoglucosyldiacylglycerol synthase [Hyphomicrobium sp. ghe19]|nr:Alpha-monoglucosyldiacylglycerol synthase [Hyphomicrobium sp. ghe19]